MSPGHLKLIRIFVSSPGDVQEERAVFDKVIDRINKTDGNRDNFRLELWRWEHDAVPQIGPSPQDIIDAQMPTDYEIYIGILAHRFGTPTGEFGSGTEKEFHDAVTRWERTKRPWILLYFKQAMVDPSTLDLEQYQKVVAFQKSVQSKGLYKNYEGVDGSENSFADHVELHLRKLIPEVLKTPDPPPTKSQSGEPTLPHEYLDWQQGQCGDVDLLGLQLKEGRSLKLDTVYVPLTTQAGLEMESDPKMQQVRMREQPDERKPQLLLDLAGRKSLYVSGDPGSGKSTFCRWVTWLACAGSLPQRTPSEPEEYKEDFPDSFRERLPLLVRLRDFWPFLPYDAGETLSVTRLEDALAAWVTERNPPGLKWDNVQSHLKQGTLLLVLDGVDEVPVSGGKQSRTYYPRSLLLNGLSAAISAWTRVGNRVLLTSRPYGLNETDRQRLQLLHAPIQDLPVDLQALLVHRWFSILRDNEAEGEKFATDMLDDLRGRSGVAELASNPMLLTAMCIIYNEGKRLPQDRCDLYTRIVDNVLYSRFKTPKEIEMVRNELCVVAHAMHAGVGDGRTTPRAQVKHDEIDRALEAYRERRRWTQAGFEDLLERREQLLSQTGLLLPRGDDEASFYHLSIQEFLAAQRIWSLASHNLADVFAKRAAIPEWRNTLSFLFGTQLSKISDFDPSSRLLEKLIDQTEKDQLGLQIVLGDCLQILLGKDVRLPEESEDKYRQMCLAAIEHQVPLNERNLLGLALGHVGDPRIVTDLRDEAAYIQIPAGSYAYQEGKQKIKKPFLLSRYPVTNSQYALFINEKGYERREFWSEEGWKWREQNEETEPDYWRNAQWNGPSQPVVTVTFWEAEAFCRWAEGELPSEKQWEAAARGSERREYPWGNDWEDGICNSHEAKLGVTSPVGLFPRSRSREFGLEDMAGNVWEWCQDAYAKHVRRRVLRGGSFSDEADNCRSAFRLSWLPDDRRTYCGFRVSRTYT